MLLYVTASNSFSLSCTEFSYQSSLPSWNVIKGFLFKPVTCINPPTLSTKEAVLIDLQPDRTDSVSWLLLLKSLLSPDSTQAIVHRFFKGLR